ncbi:unnamed protein product, partial [Mesorhabditis belari]|uniref:RGS domain-containing protein n=1 Tax=Mesorhabditis belari TaxID=2138241 RepID=A0AAF3J3J0_9BILA
MIDWPTSWSRSLENVLQDRAACDAFRSWLVANNVQHGLELHFAVRAYTMMVRDRNPQAGDLAKQIYQRYVSLRTGTAAFIPARIRQELSNRIKQPNFVADPRFFDLISPFVEDYLRKQHEEFCTTDEFIEAFNRMALEEFPGQQISTSMFEPRASSRSHTLTNSHSGTAKRSRSRRSPFLTAEALIRSKHDREAALGESHVERMYRGPRMPYTCHATTSQHDSAVSSSFSSEANRSIRLTTIREGHLRENPATFTIPRVDRSQHFRDDSNQYDHETEDGRRLFHATICEKLNREIRRRRRNEATEKQIDELERSKEKAREVISSTECDVMMDGEDMEDDDLERYVEGMRGESGRQSTTNRTPRTGRELGIGGETGPMTPLRGFSLGRSTLERSLMERRFPLGEPIDPIDLDSSFAAPTTYPGRFAPPPTTGFNTGFNTFGKDRSYSIRTEPVYNPESGIGSMFSQIDDKRRTRGGEKERERRSRPPITITYKAADGVPIVAHVPLLGHSLTLREFRKHFSISSQLGYQFFFKSECEDGSAPYQLLRICDDAALLPIFDGKISAEIKQTSPE